MRALLRLRVGTKRMIRACPHHKYAGNHLNTFFYDGLNASTKALLDSAIGG